MKNHPIITSNFHESSCLTCLMWHNLTKLYSCYNKQQQSNCHDEKIPSKPCLYYCTLWEEKLPAWEMHDEKLPWKPCLYYCTLCEENLPVRQILLTEGTVIQMKYHDDEMPWKPFLHCCLSVRRSCLSGTFITENVSYVTFWSFLYCTLNSLSPREQQIGRWKSLIWLWGYTHQ